MPTTYLRPIGDPHPKFAPLPADHPLVTEHEADAERCPGCHRRFIAGDITTIVVIGPGDDPEAQRKAREGHPYNAVGVVAHWSCVTGEP